MTALVRAELRQLRSTRATWGLLVAALALCLTWTAMVLSGVGGIESPPRGSAQLRDMLFGAAGIGCIPILLLGLLTVTGEFHHRTATPAFLVVPDRRKVLAAKAVACVLVAPPVAVVLTAVPYAVGIVSGAVEPTLDQHVLAVLGRAMLVFTCWALLGVGIGAAVRNQTVAVVLPLLWFGVVEQMAPMYPALRWLVPWLPSGVLTAVGGGRFPGSLPLWVALVAFAAYLLVLYGSGVRRIIRLDVT
jgi:ABC-2 type transport system permease protein